MKAKDLRCIGKAQAGAEALEKKFPQVRFTSGARAVQDQARAMAQNVVKDRTNIDVYISPMAAKLKAWMNAHPGKLKQAVVEAAFAQIIGSWTPEEQKSLSRHIGGLAWDIQPIPEDPQAADIIAYIKTLPGYQNFLEKEGKLVRWHAQFHAD